jgi:hypothetical protein
LRLDNTTPVPRDSVSDPQPEPMCEKTGIYITNLLMELSSPHQLADLGKIEATLKQFEHGGTAYRDLNF